MKNKRFELDPQTLRLLQVIESTEDESQRQAAINDLAHQGGMNAARILIETFERCMWRSTKVGIIQAMGKIQHERATEFLCRLAGDASDFGLASEAIFALGTTDDPVAGEFLASILRLPSHPLLREALTAIANLNFFPSDFELREIFTDENSRYPASAKQNAMIVAGLCGYRAFIPQVLECIKPGVPGPLFNAGLMAIGRLGDRDSLIALETLDTRYRSFAHQLKLAAIDHLRLSTSYTIEDAIHAAINAKSLQAQRHAWIVLGGFPTNTASEALQILAGESSPDFKIFERIFFYDQKRLDQDFDFLMKSQAQLSPNLFAALARKHVNNHPAKSMTALLRKLGDAFAIKVLSLVRIDGGWSLLVDLMSKEGAPLEIRHRALNALVAQYIMHGMSDDIRDVIGKHLVRLVEAQGESAFVDRIIRAIGQIRYTGPDAINLLRERLKSGENIEAVYSSLSLCESEDASKIIAKRLRQIISSPTSENEVRAALRSLARSGQQVDASFLAQMPNPLIEEFRITILKLLTVSFVKELIPFVESSLQSADFQVKILSVAAARIHQSEKVADILFQYLDHNNQSIAGRALDTLVTSYGSKEHGLLFARALSHPDDELLYKKMFKSLAPRPNESYQAVVDALDEMIRGRKGVMADHELVQAAINVRDNLVAMSTVHSVKQVDSDRKKSDLIDRHAIDELLGKNVRGFEKYSPTVKSVLRSGEVTWQHPELFDARVDKSTVLVQYVKSIDLLLQEKIGAQMFLGQGAEFLQKMQSRVIRLELDDDTSVDPHLVSSLECSMYFARDSFPTHKILTLCKFVMTGQIMKEQYKIVDGLRAWAVLILLFGRTFRFRGQILEPLFPLPKSSNEAVCRIARAMNDLQEARNRAAHRGTVLEKDHIKELRDLSAALLNDLDSYLG
jgi:HEAT repeat protein